MKILHTSDWHIGRTFHGHSTVENLQTVLAALVEVVRVREIDVVVVSGDIFDSATPAADYYTVLTSTLRQLRDAGATVIMTSGNHDSATRLGFQSEFAGLAGIHIITQQHQHDQPITIDDEHGPVHFYGIPYLEPSLVRHHYPHIVLKNHQQVLAFVMDRIRHDLTERAGRSVVLSHCFAVGGGAEVAASDVERDITAGGLDYVPVNVFDGPDYVALGHIHSRAQLSERVRYSGAPLHYSFTEAGKPRGAWLVELGAEPVGSGSGRVHANGETAERSGTEPAPAGIITAQAAPAGTITNAEWIDLPVPRRLTVLTGTIDELLTTEIYAAHESDWISAILTDQVRPLDGMRRLQQRYAWCVTLEHRPSTTAATSDTTYTERLRGKNDNDIVADFLAFVRNGVGPSQYERELIADVLTDVMTERSASEAIT